MPASDDWCTPTLLTDTMPRVDLDPCANVRSTVPARRQLLLEHGDNGLALPWAERPYYPEGGPVFDSARYCRTTFVNPPFSDVTPWIRASGEFYRDGGESLVLVKLDPTTKWWALAREFGAVWFPFRKRLRFAGAPASAPWPCALWWFSHRDTLTHFGAYLEGLEHAGIIWWN